MASFSAKHLHFVPFNVNPVAGRSRLLAASPNGLIFSTRDNDLIVFRAADYVGASAISNLRKDKPLDSLRPNISLSFSRQITWLAVNCNGSLLSVCSSMPNGATFIQLLEISKMSPTENFGFLGEPLNLSAPEAGAEADNSPQASSAIADLAWSPVDPNRLAVATQSGSLRMFVCSGQDVQKPLTLVGSLPQAAQVKCISWSPKGKQLAVCLTGIIPNFPAVPTTVILQLDPELRQKRVIPLSPILQSFAQFPQGRPIDMLWSSSYCFLVALEGPTPQQGTCVAFVSALPKSEPRGALVESLAGVYDSTAVQPFQYHMRLWPNSGCLVAATWSSGGETCILLEVPALSSTGGGLPLDSLPKLLTEMVLPSTKAPIALGMSAVLKDAEVLPLLVTRLGNGIVCAYEMLQGPNADPAAFAGFRTWLQAAAPAPNLPAVSPAAVQPTTTTTTTSAQSSAPTTKGATSTLAAATTAAGLFGGSTFGQQSAPTTPAHPGTAATTTGLFGGTAFGQQSSPNVSSATPTAPPTSMFGGTLFGQKSAPDVSSPPTSVFGGTLFGQKSAPDVSSATPTAPPTNMFGGTLFGQQSAPNVSAATTTAAASSLFGSTVFGRQSAQGPQATVSSADATSTASPAAQPASPLKASTQTTTAPPTAPSSIFSSSSGGGLFGSGVGGQPTGAPGFGATTFGRPSTPQQTFGLPVTSTTTAAVPNASVGAAVAPCTEPNAAQSPTSPRGDVPLPTPPPPPQQELKSPDPVSTTPQPLKQEAPEETGDLDRAPSPAPIPHSVLEASDQFSLALQAQATDTARAWQHLTEVFSGTSAHLAALASVSGLLPEGCCKGVRDIEKSLTNMSTYLDVVNEITRQLEKATALSLAEQKSLADFVGRLHVDFEAYTDNLTPKFTAGLDPESAAMLASLKKKSRSAETYLAELEDQLESLSTQVEEETAAEKSKSSLPHESNSSPLESVRRTLAVNARLIAAERARIEMISRFSGISLSSSQIAAASPVRRRAGDTPQTPNSAGGRSANHLTKSASSRAWPSGGGSSLRSSPASAGAPTKSLPLGGSVVSLEREQRDAALYRLLVKAAAASTGGGSQALPIHRVAQTAGQLFESTATRGTLDQSAADVDKKSPSRTTQRQSPRVRSSPAAAACVSPGRIQGQQISRLLDRAASVPPVTLPTGGSPLPVVEPSAVTAGTPRSPPPPARSESFLSSAQSRLHGRGPASAALSPHPLDTALASPMAPEGAGSSPVAAAAPRITSTPRWSVQPPGLTVKPPVGHVFQAGATTTPSAPAARLPTTTKKPEKPKSKPENALLAVQPFGSSTATSTATSATGSPRPESTASPAASMRTPPSSDSPKATSLSASLVSPPVVTTLSPTVKVFGAPRNLVFETSQTLPTVTQSPAVPQIVVSPSTAGEAAAASTTTSAATTAAPAASMTAVAPSTTAVTTTSSTGLLSKQPTASSAATTTSAAPTTAASAARGIFVGQPIVGFGAATSQPTATSSPPASPISFGLFGQASKAPPAAPTPSPVTTTAAPVSSSAPAASSSVSSLFAQPKFSAAKAATAASPTTTFSFGPVSAAATTATTGFGSPFGSTPATASPMTTAAAATATAATTAAATGAGPVSTSTGGLFGTASTKSTEGGLFGQPGGLFGSASKTTSGLFGQQQAASADGGLFGVGGQKAATTTAATAGVGFFGSPNTTSGAGLFGDTKTASTTTAGGLFGGPSATGGLFGAPAATAGQLFGSGGQSAATVGAFGSTSTASPSVAAGGGLFGQAGAKPASGGLFGAAAAGGGGGGGLFGQTAVSPGGGGGLFGQMAATTTSAPTPGLFGSPAAAAAPSGGLFGTSSQAQQSGTAAVSNLFATSNFGLGSPSTTSSSGGGGGGLFGKPAASNTSVPGSTGLFGSPTSTAAPGGGGLFGASPSGLFAAPTLGKTVFGAASTGAGGSSGGGGLFGSFTNTAGGGGGLFGAASNTAAPGGGGGGLFGSSTAAPSSGGLFSSAAAPASGGLFGAGSGFGAPPAFGSVNAPQANPLTFPIPSSPSAGGFGSAPVFGQSSPFGAAAAASPAAGGLFASLANSTNASTFGSLAHNTPSPPAPQNLFGSSPSFTQRRA